MYLNDFSVQVLEGSEKPGGYVEISHGQTYRLRLRNNHNVRCDARVEIDGKEIGVFRIWSRGSITLERPLNDDEQFTFYEVGSPEANKIGLERGDSKLGLISVTFTPEKRPSYVVSTTWSPTWDSAEWPSASYKPEYTYRSSGDSTSPYNDVHISGAMYASTEAATRKAGGTGLSGKSNQEFRPVGSINYDYTLETTINLRLVSRSNDEPRPLVANSNPVPPPV